MSVSEKRLHRLSILVIAAFAATAPVGCDFWEVSDGHGRQIEVLQSDKPRDTSPQVDPAELDRLAAGNRAFAFDLYQALRGEGGNLFYSPYSISVALAMTYAGARQDLLPPGSLTPVTRLVLTNAIYFNAAWHYPFDEKLTREGPFHRLDGSRIADFSGMDGTRDLSIGDVLHKAFVSVDEAGTEAAAATAVSIGIVSMPPPPVEVTLDPAVHLPDPRHRDRSRSLPRSSHKPRRILALRRVITS